MKGQKTIIVKIGGKILDNSKNLQSTISQLQSLIDAGKISRVIIIPGGGSLANFIRNMDKKMALGTDLAHWMAIYAMNYNGIKLNREFSHLNYFENIEDLQLFVQNETRKSIIIFLPYDFLIQEDQLPHSWNVTSDSITLYITAKLKLKQCFLIKDVDGIIINENGKKKVITEITTSDYMKFKGDGMIETKDTQKNELKKSQPVDPYLLSLIEASKIPCIILNGTVSKSRIVNYFDKTNKTNKVYTKIY